MDESSGKLRETVPKIHFLNFLETSVVLQHNVRLKREYRKGKYFTQKCFTPVSQKLSGCWLGNALPDKFRIPFSYSSAKDVMALTMLRSTY